MRVLRQRRRLFYEGLWPCSSYWLLLNIPTVHNPVSLMSIGMQLSV